MSRVGLVVGMRAEAARAAAAGRTIAEPDRPLIFTAGASGARAERGGLDLAAAGVAGLVSFGLAGGLDPRFRAGDVILAEEIVTAEGGRLETDPAWRSRVGERLAVHWRLASGAVAGCDRIVSGIADKASLRRATGAGAVDMESHGVGHAAQATGLPFLAIRIVLDTASQAVPWSAQAGLDDKGEVRPLAVAWRLARRPWELPSLLALRRDSRAALGVLGRVALELAAFRFGM